MVLMALFTTFMTTPLVIATYKPAKMAVTEYKNRTIMRKDTSKQLRILTCFHGTRNIPTLINLIEATRGTDKKEGLRVYAMHLLELTERPSAILMVHKVRKNGLPLWNKEKAGESNQVIVAFETFGQLSKVSIRPNTAISPMSSMHEDIIASAERKRVSMIIVPFHKHQRLDGHFETTRADLRNVNRRVLEHAPCSVGIIIDRGLGGASHVSASEVDYSVLVLFFGGHDDREALAYGMRVAEHPGITLNVVRFIIDPAVIGASVHVDIVQNSSPVPESQEDEIFLSDMKQKSSGDSSIVFQDSIVKDIRETTEVIRGFKKCNLFIVGRMSEGQLVSAFDSKSHHCPELGPLGNLLISGEISTSASVLVVQQYRSELPQESLRSLRAGDSSRVGSSRIGHSGRVGHSARVGHSTKGVDGDEEVTEI